MLQRDDVCYDDGLRSVSVQVTFDGNAALPTHSQTHDATPTNALHNTSQYLHHGVREGTDYATDCKAHSRKEE